MTTRSRPRAALLAAAIMLAPTLGAAACSSGGDDKADDKTTSTTESGKSTTTEANGTTSAPVDLNADEQAYADALIDAFDPETDQPFTKDDIECLATGWVHTIGVDTFTEAGITPEELASEDSDMSDLKLDKPTAEAMVDGMAGCGISLKEMIMSTFVTADVTDEQRACVEKALDEDLLRDAMVASFQGQEDTFDDAAFEDAGKCLLPAGSDTGSTSGN